MVKKRTVSRSGGAATTKTAWRFDTLFVFQIVVAVFLFTAGLMVVVGWNWNPSRFEQAVTRIIGRPHNPVNLIIAIVEIVAGVLLVAALFVPVRTKWLYWTTLVIAIAWVIRIVLVQFAYSDFDPFLAWLNSLAADLVLLLALWMINRKYA
jgi:uncharacterized membrane protein YphA (DoxX/SURF4 family)